MQNVKGDEFKVSNKLTIAQKVCAYSFVSS